MAKVKQTKYFKLTGNFVAANGKSEAFPIDTNMDLKNIEVTYSTEGQITIDLTNKTFTCANPLENTKFPVMVYLKNKDKGNESIGEVKFALAKANATDPNINYTYDVEVDVPDPVQPTDPVVPNPPTGTDEEKRIAVIVNAVYTHGVNLGYNKLETKMKDFLLKELGVTDTKTKTAVEKQLA